MDTQDTFPNVKALQKHVASGLSVAGYYDAADYVMSDWMHEHMTRPFPTPTDPAVLAAALALPEVREVMDLMKRAINSPHPETHRWQSEVREVLDRIEPAQEGSSDATDLPKPCPFCGCGVIFPTIYGKTTKSWGVLCNGCDAWIEGYDSEQLAIAAWNKRCQTKDR